jgi:hypothetical protein
MKRSQQNKLTCGRCKEPIKQKDSFCKNCGGLFSGDLLCVNHKSIKAEGVCVICSKPFCKKCGADVLKVFLCDKHSDLEITEGKVRVFGTTDNVRAQFASACLKQAGYHPFIYSRLFNPVADKVAITGIRNFGNHPIEEQKVFIPFSEFKNASRELKKHKFKEI